MIEFFFRLRTFRRHLEPLFLYENKGYLSSYGFSTYPKKATLLDNALLYPTFVRKSSSVKKQIYGKSWNTKLSGGFQFLIFLMQE